MHVVAACMGQGGHPARTGCSDTPSRCPSPGLGCGGLGAAAGGSNRGGSAPTDGPAYPRLPTQPHNPPGVIPYALADEPTSPARAPWAPPATPAQAPLPAPWTHQPQVPVAKAPWQAASAAYPPPPPRRAWAPPASRQLTIEVYGLSPDTMTTTAVREALRAHLESAKHVPVLSLRRGYE